MISGGFYIPEAMGWPFNSSSGFILECDGCEPKGWVSHDQCQLSQWVLSRVGEVTSDAANVMINGMGLSMGNES